MHEKFHPDAMSAIKALELELIVRDFVDVLNDGAVSELHPFLTDDVIYRPWPRQIVCGRRAVIGMIEEIASPFEEWRTSLVNVAVTGDVVLAEEGMRLKLPARDPQCVMAFASFRIDGFRICAWHQLHG